MRAERRHHRERLKASRRFFWGRDLRQEPGMLAAAVDTPTPCSCWMCSAQKAKEPHVSELRAREAWRKIERA